MTKYTILFFLCFFQTGKYAEYYNKGKQKIEVEDYEGARKEFLNAFKVRPTAKVALCLAYCYAGLDSANQIFFYISKSEKLSPALDDFDKSQLTDLKIWARHTHYGLYIKYKVTLSNDKEILFSDDSQVDTIDKARLVKRINFDSIAIPKLKFKYSPPKS